eukprot:TRINITY_DN1733_c0_g3_i1.p1 TRINITY_DN1733_c0_g3~~TRINITY_DN1733_c0_g3_i1.p1  ORF type:complete len:209 (+),score=60.51 TRINITY_DN1733_c0_g3_i1:35-661(+)
MQSQAGSSMDASVTKMATESMAQNMAGGGMQVDDGTMEDILEKLKILNYMISFAQTWPSTKGHNYRPLTRTYFCAPAGNLNEQYFYFASLTAWLVSICGGKIDAPDQFDDPNVVSTNIIQALKDLDLPVRDIMPSKIRQGFGDSVLLTLSMLTDQALKEKGFQFVTPTYPADKYDDDMNIEDPSAVGDDGIIDDIAVREDSDDDVCTT